MELSQATPLVSRYLQPSATEEHRAGIVGELSQLLATGDLNILAVVAALQDCLTSDDSSLRVLGTLLLSQLLQLSGSALTSNDIHHLSLFMSSRLSDWPCTEPAAQGCTALLGLKSQQQVAITEPDALVIVRAAAEQLAGHVQQLAQRERSASLTLLLVCAQDWGVSAAQAGVNLVEACIAAMDGEKDPRCLLSSFQLVQAVAGVYHSRGVDASPLVDQSEEVVEVLSCYFPLTFNPPKSDPHKISRAELASGLMASLSCSPFIVRWALPLVLEKLSSTYKPAKEDALAALAACCQGGGKEALQPHMGEVWSALRNEISSPSAYGLTSGDDLTTARQLSETAAICLTRCTASLGPGGLEAVSVSDSLVSELLGAVRGASVAGPWPRMEGGDPGRPDRQLVCAATALGAVAAGGDWAAQRISQLVLDPLLDMLPPPAHQPAAAAAAATTAAESPAASATQPSAAGQPQAAAAAVWCSHRLLYCLAACHHLLQQAATSLQEAQQAAGQGSSGAADAAGGLQLQPQPVLEALRGAGGRLGEVAVRAVDALVPLLSGGALEVDSGEGVMDPACGVQILLTACACLISLCTLHSLGSPSTPPFLDPSLMSHLASSVTLLTLAAPPANVISDGEGEGWLMSSVPARMLWGQTQVPVESGMAVVVAALKASVGAVGAVGTVGVQQVVLGHLMGGLCSGIEVTLPPGQSVTPSCTAGPVAWGHVIGICSQLAVEVPTLAVGLLGALAPVVPVLLAAPQGPTTTNHQLPSTASACKELLGLVSTCLEAGGKLSSSLPADSSRSAAQLAATLMTCCAPNLGHGGAALGPDPGRGGGPTLDVDLLVAVAAAAGRVVASCTVEDQAALAVQGCQHLTASLSQPVEAAGAPAGEVDVVAAAVVAGVQPGALPSGLVAPLCGLLLGTCTAPAGLGQAPVADLGQGGSLGQQAVHRCAPTLPLWRYPPSSTSYLMMPN